MCESVGTVIVEVCAICSFSLGVHILQWETVVSGKRGFYSAIMNKQPGRGKREGKRENAPRQSKNKQQGSKMNDKKQADKLVRDGTL